MERYNPEKGHYLCVDPGLRGSGIALFNSIGNLVVAYYAKNPLQKVDGPRAWYALANKVFNDMKELGYRIDYYVVEVPQVYSQIKRSDDRQSDPNDLIQVVGVGSAIGAAFPLRQAIGYRPREWKGQVPKYQHNKRVVAQLEPEEVALFAHVPKYLQHNVIDAIGIGLFHFDRVDIRFASKVVFRGGEPHVQP